MVTGGASGIGAAASTLGVERGFRVAVCDINAEGARALALDLGDGATAVDLDVREPEHWQRALDQVGERFGRLDVLVNNAGLHQSGLALDVALERHRDMIDVNLFGLIAGVQAAVPRFLRQGSGQIVNMASLASFVPMTGQATYAATKHAVRAFHYGLAMELRDGPVDLTLICPPAVETPMVERQLWDDAAALTFADPPVTAQDVARAIMRAVVEKPSEIIIPAVRGRFIRLVGSQPGVVRRLVPRAERRGRKRLEAKRRAGTRASDPGPGATGLTRGGQDDPRYPPS